MKEKLSFAIRDDDVSYFTKANEYNLFCEKFVKNFTLISGIILNQKGCPSLNIPLQYWYTGLNYNIKDNFEICDLLHELDKRNNFFPAVHGYEHNFIIENNNLIPELRLRNAIVKLSKNLDEAEKFFKETFSNPIKIFIPPSNTISSDCAELLFKRDYTLFNYPGIFRHSRRSSKGYRILIQRILNLMLKKIDLQKPYYETKYSKCFNSVPLTTILNQNKLNSIANECSTKGYPFILSLHQWELNCFQPYSQKTYSDLLLDTISFLELNYELVDFNPKGILMN
ncbi:hypothetical protein [Prochlorococcus marinus]|uniref:hypothetical protein n=1 Tax=Prochlorococcus marinus TaxID=1219 RepID=UPI001AD9744F|nr:hypothetical protein [Prochlorococcus marinus]MBO8204941.1 hypothetical protein [Prochlorococcus marinus CUG1415]MBW3044213.1 hypothetical protein [Prochlorococcus marinus str. MU1415]